MKLPRGMKRAEFDVLRKLAKTPAGQRAIRREVRWLKLKLVWLRARRIALELWYLPGSILALPEGHPHRRTVASVILYGGAAIMALALVLR